MKKKVNCIKGIKNYGKMSFLMIMKMEKLSESLEVASQLNKKTIPILSTINLYKSF